MSLASSSTTATFFCDGWYPACENPTTGARFQPAMVLGRTDHSTTLPVACAGSSVRTTYQPFCATFRPSSSCRPVAHSITTRRAGSSGARTSAFPAAIGSTSTYSPRPRSSKVVWPSNWRICVAAGLTRVGPDG